MKSAIASLSDWTPRRAAKFSRDRIARIEHLLAEISYCWGDVDNAVVGECDRLIEDLKELRASVEYAGEHSHG